MKGYLISLEAKLYTEQHIKSPRKSILAKRVMIVLLQGTFFRNLNSLHDRRIKLKTYQDKFLLFIMLKLKQVVDLTWFNNYIKPFQWQLVVAMVT